MHFAVALAGKSKISDEDVMKLSSTNPLLMHRFSEKNGEEDESDDESMYGEEEESAATGCTPIHLLCMEKSPNMSLVRYFCCCDPQAFLLCDQSDRCTLHLVAQYSESVELIQTVLQIDSTMTKKLSKDVTPLGLLSRRYHLSTSQMVSCLIEVDSSVKVVYNGAVECIIYSNDSCGDIVQGSRGEGILILLELFLVVNPNVIKHNNFDIIHRACIHLKGSLGVAFLSTVLSIDTAGIKVLDILNGYLPIHYAVKNSSLDVVALLHNAYPESLTMLTNNGSNLLHLLCFCQNVKPKVVYLCDQCPALMHMRDNDGKTPLHASLMNISFDYHYRIMAKCNFTFNLCNKNRLVLEDKYTRTIVTSQSTSQQLPLHLLIARIPIFSSSKLYDSELYDSKLYDSVSGTGDLFRLFLRLFPASAGIKDGHSQSPYDLAISKKLNVYFIRLLLANDPSVNPVKGRNLNYAARKEGLFLAFRALSTNRRPTIWANLRYESKDLLRRVIMYL
jgi:hypothetical protein